MDWPTVATIATPIAVLAINYLLQRRPNVIAHYGDISAFVLKKGTPDSQTIHSHTVILRNAGRATATGVRLRHNIFPEEINFQPKVDHEEIEDPDGGGEIVIPRLRPKEYVQIAYMYGPDIQYSQIHGGIVHDDGFAKPISVVLQRQYPAWFNLLSAALALTGLMFAVYWSVRLGIWMWGLLI